MVLQITLCIKKRFTKSIHIIIIWNYGLTSKPEQVTDSFNSVKLN